MLRILVVLAIFVAAANADCGRSRNGDWRIMFGDHSVQDQWPWMAHLQIMMKGGYMTCGGSLIDAYTVVTAAHCFSNDRSEDLFYVTVGSNNWQNVAPQYKHLTKFIRVHGQFSQYMGVPMGDDIMILKLRNPIPNVAPICLPQPGEVVPPGTTCYVSGWGKTESGTDSPHLKHVAVKLLDNGHCQNLRREDNITPQRVCAGIRERNACMGDSGGPLQCLRNDGRWVLTGIVSYGDKQCGIVGRPGVYTRVTSYLDWIYRNRV